MAKRKIIKIDEEKCNGCGLCIPQSGKDIPFKEVVISIKGERLK